MDDDSDMDDPDVEEMSVWNRCLPEDVTRYVADEERVRSAYILEGLRGLTAASDVNEYAHWSQEVQTFFRLKYNVPDGVLQKMVELLLGLLELPMSVVYQNHVLSAALHVLRKAKRRQRRGGLTQLTVQWRPLYQLMELRLWQRKKSYHEGSARQLIMCLFPTISRHSGMWSRSHADPSLMCCVGSKRCR